MSGLSYNLWKYYLLKIIPGIFAVLSNMMNDAESVLSPKKIPFLKEMTFVSAAHLPDIFLI